MADYAKKTVAELTEILKTRGLPSSGKKAELVARLNQNDKEAEAPDEAPATEAESTVAAPAPPEPAAQPEAESVPPTESGNAATVSETNDATTTSAAAEPESTTYTLNLKASDLDSELAKRKARAERFGTTATTSGATNGKAAAADTSATDQLDAENQALKNIERAKRFGTQSTAISKLDEALPTERVRGNKRKADDTAPTTLLSSALALDDPGLKRSFANRAGGGGGARGGRFRSRGSHKQGAPRSAGAGGIAGGGGITKNTNVPAYTSDKDRLAAEARKKKFATA